MMNICGIGIVTTLLACSHPSTSPQRQPLATPDESPAAKRAVSPGTVEGAPALLPTGLTSFGATVHDNALYVLGGYFGEPHKYRAEHQSRELLRLSLGAPTAWESLPGLASGLQSVALVTKSDALHRVGGMRVGDDGQPRSVDEHAYFVEGQWQDLPAMPRPRSSHDAVTHDDTIYVVGGWQLNGGGSGDFFDDMWVYRKDTGWRQVPSPVQRRALAVATTDHHLVAIGGFDADRAISDRVDVYDIESKTWSRGPAFPGKKNGFGVAATGSGDQVYASGRDGTVWRWRVGSKGWERVGALVFPRFFHRLVSPTPDLIVAVGGIGGMHTFGRTRHVETFRISPQTRAPLVLWTLPSPTTAKNRQGAFLSGDDLVLFGGNNSLGQHDFEPQNFLDSAHAIHLPSLTSRSVASYPAKRQTMQTVVLDGVGVSVGGFGHDGAVARTQADAFSYHVAKNEWVARPSLPVARSQFGLVAHRDFLWVFGGLNYDPTRKEGEQFQHLTTVRRAPADGSAAFVDAGIELPRPRRAFGGALYKGRYYLVGGMQSGFELVDDCTAYDFLEMKWSSIECPLHVRLNPQLVTVGDKLVLVGGSAKVGDKLSEDRRIEIYDPATNTWSDLGTTLPFSPKHMRAFAYRGQLLIYSAHNEDGLIHLGLVSLDAGATP